MFENMLVIAGAVVAAFFLYALMVIFIIATSNVWRFR